MIIQYSSVQAGQSAGVPAYFSFYKDNELVGSLKLLDGLNDVPEELADQLKNLPNINWYLMRGAIAFREDQQQTPFTRRHELEQLYESQGYQAIANLAVKYSISKPKTGWKDAIPLIVEYEKVLQPPSLLNSELINEIP